MFNIEIAMQNGENMRMESDIHFLSNLEERLGLIKEESKYQNEKSKLRENLADKLTSLYKSIFAPIDFEKKLLSELVLGYNPNSILEEGAGDDVIYKSIFERSYSSTYYRSDVSVYQLNKVIDKRIINLPYDGVKHELGDNSVDVVFSKCVFHHIDNGCEEGREKNRIDYLTEQKRVVKEGGAVITMDITNPLQSSIKSKFWHYFKHRLLLGENKHNFLNEKETIRLYELAGFDNIHSQTVDTYKGEYFVVIGEKYGK